MSVLNLFPQGNFSPFWYFAMIVIALWELAWKGIALWRAARNNSPWWFFFLLILNTVGILPIIYILFFSKKKASPVQQ